MNARPIDEYFLQKDEPTKSCLQFLREHILQLDTNITEAWKYGMPFYCYKGKMFLLLVGTQKISSTLYRGCGGQAPEPSRFAFRSPRPYENFTD
jgi:hypothetical protein